jgi:hypothetical protein
LLKRVVFRKQNCTLSKTALTQGAVFLRGIGDTLLFSKRGQYNGLALFFGQKKTAENTDVNFSPPFKEDLSYKEQ